MNPQHVPAAPRPILVAVLRGRWLGLARAGWVVLTFLSLGLFIAGIPAEFAQLQVVCPTEFCASGQLPPAGLRALQMSVGRHQRFDLALCASNDHPRIGVSTSGRPGCGPRGYSMPRYNDRS